MVLPGEQFGTITEAEAIELFRRDLFIAESAINQGNWALAKRELLRWVYADGKVPVTLVVGREAKASLLSHQ